MQHLRMPSSLGTLARVPLFASLEPGDVRALDYRCVWRRVSGGDWVAGEQLEGRDVYFVVSGHVHVLSGSSDRATILCDLRDGQHIGEVAAIDGNPAMIGLRAIADSVVARMSPAVFLEAVHRYPGVSDAVLGTLAHAVRILAKRADEHTRLHVRERLSAELLRLSRTSAAGRLVVSPPPTHAELAARIGTNREGVTRSLKALELEGAITRTRSAIVIFDPDTLRDVAGEGK